MVIFHDSNCCYHQNSSSNVFQIVQILWSHQSTMMSLQQAKQKNVYCIFLYHKLFLERSHV